MQIIVKTEFNQVYLPDYQNHFISNTKTDP